MPFVVVLLKFDRESRCAFRMVAFSYGCFNVSLTLAVDGAWVASFTLHRISELSISE
jgi:hypothetical protein